MPLNWQLWDRVRAFARAANVYRTDNVYQDQDILDRIISGGNFIDFSRSGALLEQTNLQINRLERYKDYDMMDEVGEVSLALDCYADESTLTDSERKHSVIVRAKNKRIKRIVEDFIYNTLLIDREVRPIIRYLCKYGDFAAEIVPTKNRNGVSSFRFVNVYNFTRVQTKYGDLVGFYYQDPGSGMPVFMHPWQVMHLRLTSYETIYHPYGKSLLDGGRKDFKRLRLMEDAALVYRLERAPEKRIFTIPVGNIPPQQVPQYIELIARQMKKYKFVDPGNGQVNERYNPLIQNDDFFLPKRADGTGPSIDTLPGAENLDAIADIEYFKKKVVAALKIPFSRVGIGEPAENEGRSLASVSPEFAKAVQWVQREFIMGLKKVVIVHLALRGHNIEDIKGVDLAMTSASAIDELYRIETWNTRADVIANLKDTAMFPDSWILERFTDMTPEEIKDMQEKQAKSPEEPVKEEVDLDPELALDEDEKKLLLENKQFDEVRKQRNGSKDKGDVNPTLEWFVNHRELDGLENGNKLLPSSLPEDVITEVRSEVEQILRASASTGEIDIPASDISQIAAEIRDIKPNVLVESKT